MDGKPFDLNDHHHPLLPCSYAGLVAKELSYALHSVPYFTFHLLDEGSSCRGRGCSFAYYHQWSDAIQPLQLSEVAPDLLDRRLALGDVRLDKELFPEPLPVYQLPWLERAPRQVWDPPPGCESYQAATAIDLLDGEAQVQLQQWWAAAVKDAQCLERLGAACDRSDKPGAIGIGQDQFHTCARGYVWDCRTRPCQLLDYHAPVETKWDLPYLRELLKDYPDQRLAHLSGDGNVPSDYVSRGLWRLFSTVCSVLRVKPVCGTLNEKERTFVTEVIKQAAARKGVILEQSQLDAAFDRATAATADTCRCLQTKKVNHSRTQRSQPSSTAR